MLLVCKRLYWRHAHPITRRPAPPAAPASAQSCGAPPRCRPCAPPAPASAGCGRTRAAPSCTAPARTAAARSGGRPASHANRLGGAARLELVLLGAHVAREGRRVGVREHQHDHRPVHPTQPDLGDEVRFAERRAPHPQELPDLLVAQAGERPHAPVAKRATPPASEQKHRHVMIRECVRTSATRRGSAPGSPPPPPVSPPAHAIHPPQPSPWAATRNRARALATPQLPRPTAAPPRPGGRSRARPSAAPHRRGLPRNIPCTPLALTTDCRWVKSGLGAPLPDCVA